MTGYRPTWISDSKPEQNCAAIIFDDGEMINPDEELICHLHPFAPELWNNIKVGVDCWAYTPISEVQVIDIIETQIRKG